MLNFANHPHGLSHRSQKLLSTLATAMLSAILSMPAAEISRGNSKSSGAAASPSPVSSPTVVSQAAADASRRAKDALNRSTAALQALQASQAAARTAAQLGPNNLGVNPNKPGLQLPDVPDGLAANGLVPDSGLSATGVSNPVVSWTGARTPVQSGPASQPTVTIVQDQQQALLNWQTFNLGKNTTLTFDQSKGGTNVGEWVAINKINDPTGNPTQILGNLKADGQVYVLNQNGILFGGSSQINTHAFVASTLPINDNLVSRGLLNNPDNQFLFSADSISTVPSGSMPAFNPPTNTNPTGVPGDVVVQSGAILSSPTSSDHVGGKIALIGSNVENKGTISTPDGQTILAAGRQVSFRSHSSSDASLRGLDVQVGTIDPKGGTATNSGLIEIPRANLTIVGKSVNQLGGVDSSTSASLNGRVDLLAEYNTTRISQSTTTGNVYNLFATATGNLTLGSNSFLRIVPEVDSTEKVVGSTLSLKSQINYRGKNIYFGTDSLSLAPNATVIVNAGQWFPSSVGYSFINSAGQVYFDSNSILDVSGSTDVEIPIEENVVKAELRGSELADSPLQRTGALRGQTVYVDIRKTGTYNGKTWIGTPVGDVSGYANLIQRGVGELTVSGGSVAVSAGESVIMKSGSQINVSGGWINYQSGTLKTTQVVSDGKVYDISQATPDRVYSGLNQDVTLTSSKWGLSETWTSKIGNTGVYEQGYQQGAAAGSVSIQAPSMALDGDLKGGAVTGLKQRTSPPSGGSISLAFQKQDTATLDYFSISPTPPRIVFKSGSSLPTPDSYTLDVNGDPSPLRTERKSEVDLIPDFLVKSGFSNLNLNNSDGRITIDSNSQITANPASSLSLKAANLDVLGSIAMPSGNLNLQVYDFSPYAFTQLSVQANPTTPAPDSTRGQLNVSSQSVLDVSGQVVDERVSPYSLQVTDGGSVFIQGYQTTLTAGSLINTSGGATVSKTGKFSYGNGGSISIKGLDPQFSSFNGSKLVFNSKVESFSGAKGGSFALTTSRIQIGGSASDSGIFIMSPDFFTQGGFTSFSLTGIGAATSQTDVYLPGLVVANQTILSPVAISRRISNSSVAGIPAFEDSILPEGTRSPVSISLNASGIKDSISNTLIARGDLIMESGSTITTDVGASVSLSGDTVGVLGSIYTPGGNITIKGADTFSTLNTDLSKATPTVDISPLSVLSARGKVVYTPNTLGYRYGSVSSGGKISLSGNIAAREGSLLDVSGTSATLDLLPSYSGATYVTSGSLLSKPVATLMESNAGSITIKGGQEVFLDSTLKGNAGGTSAQGGSLSISSDFIRPGESLSDTRTTKTPLDVSLQVTQSGRTLSESYTKTQGSVAGETPLDSQNQPILGKGYISVDRFSSGGFDSLNLDGTSQFVGPVVLHADNSIRIASQGALFADSSLTVSASYVFIGKSFLGPISPTSPITAIFGSSSQPLYLPPTYGTGSLVVNANLIDLGSLTLQNIGSTTLNAVSGDIRGDGAIDVAGQFTLHTGQIYAPTAGHLVLSVNDYQENGSSKRGSITILAGASRQTPLSAGGEISVYGSKINQSGALRVPFGSINLGWDGTGTAPVDLITGNAVAVTTQLTLGSGSLTSVSGIDSATGKDVVVPYGYNLNGVSWIDPAGTDITASGIPEKTVTISGQAISIDSGSKIDIRGGGDLYSSRFVKGTGGSTDFLSSNSSFAIIPSYQADYAPVDSIYSNSTLKVGDKIHLGAGAGLPEGNYTLLPARYALLGGAYLITPQSTTPSGTITRPDGSVLVSGYRFNDANVTGVTKPVLANYELASSSVVRARGEYDDFSANTFLKNGAVSHDQTVPRLPFDSGILDIKASSSLSILGTVQSNPATNGRGGLVDIASSSDILIYGPQTNTTGLANTLLLDSAGLSAFGADSLMIGGIRTASGTTATVNVTTSQITVDNSGSSLSGPDIILVSKSGLTVKDGSKIEQSGSLSTKSDTLLLGQVDPTTGAITVSGNGSLLRVSSDATASVSRAGVSDVNSASQKIGSNVTISGNSVILDSTQSTELSSSALVQASSLSLASGQISLQLNNPGDLQKTNGLVITSDALTNLQSSAKSLGLLSYSSIDFYGTGQIGSVDTSGKATLTNLNLHTAEIRGFNTGNGSITLNSQNISLDNSPGRNAVGVVDAASGVLNLKAENISIGFNQTSSSLNNRVQIDQFSAVNFTSTKGIQLQNKGGLNPGLSVSGNLSFDSPQFTSITGANTAILSSGALSLANSSASSASTAASGLGATVTLTGDSITVSSQISLPSGNLNINATSGDISIGGRLQVNGTSQEFFDRTQYTSGGNISLSATSGKITIADTAQLDVSAPDAAGNAGNIRISAKAKTFDLLGALVGSSGPNGDSGTFLLDVGSLSADSFSSISSNLTSGGFTKSRSFRVRTGDVTISGFSKAREFKVSADTGSINVKGTIDASGTTGGTIFLAAGTGIDLQSAALLDVSGSDFSNSGKGGLVSLEIRGNNNGTINLGAGSTIDLSVDSQNNSSASLGRFAGKLHLRAPQLSNASDLQINPIQSTITGGSAIEVEGYKVFDLTNASGSTITASVQSNVKTASAAFVDNSISISTRLLSSSPSVTAPLIILPGSEIINTKGDLTLGSTSNPNTNSTASDWDLSSFRFGTNNNIPGVLTLKAAGNLNFYSTLSDGFASSSYDAALLNQDLSLPANVQSWSFNLTAGADFSSADLHALSPLANLGSTTGSLRLGKNYGNNVFSPTGVNSGLTRNAVLTRYQVIRTGSGDIDISVGRDLQLLNQFATIFTAGVQVSDPTMGGTFDLPKLDGSAGTGALGALQENPAYPTQYSFAGGNVTIVAQNNVIHLTQLTNGTVVDDTAKQMPTNWLYRRGYVNASTGNFGTARFGDVASTTWWVDFSNFFEDIGALGGGDVKILAGNDVKNIDAVAPTNARMTGKNASGQAIAPDAANLIELGGGNVTIQAGHNIDAGVYYVERGRGRLTAGNEITTNALRSPSSYSISRNNNLLLAPQAWLPATLFLGKGNFEVSSTGDLLLGPVANTFLMPGGYSNTFWYKTYYSTYDGSSSVSATSLTGDVTVRENINSSSFTGPVLQAWYNNVLRLTSNPASASFSQPWLRLDETSVNAFATVSTLLPGTVRLTSFNGDINLVGTLNIAPAAKGTVELLSSGSINGLQIQGTQNVLGTNTSIWAPAVLNLSDADPASIPGISTPFAYQSLVGNISSQARVSGNSFLSFVDKLFAETGSSTGSKSILQTKQALHSADILHLNDDTPAYLYANGGDITGFTFFSAKSTRIVAGNDISDIALYLQNVNSNDTSVVSAGRDLIAYNPNSGFQIEAHSTGNQLASGYGYEAGDIQINGPGTLEVLAGRNFDLGVGASNADGTGVGITSIGNARNPYLPFSGASVVAGAGIGLSSELDNSALNFTKFISTFLDPSTAGSQAERYLPSLGSLMGLGNSANSRIWSAFAELPGEKRAQFALQIFYLVLRDAGRDHGKSSSAGFGNYDAGYKAINSLFSGDAWSGDVSLTSRQIKTKNGGDISIFAPGGNLTVGFDIAGNSSADQGVLTEYGGNINIFTKKSVNVGTSRIFTLRGGNEIIWSSIGDIAAGASSKTVQSAPPTRVLIDPQSANVKTDLAGLATGGGIGVLTSVAGVPPGDVDLIAPVGTIDAGDAGIRVSGNINISAAIVLNASNIQVGGSSAGVPSVSAPSINVGSLSSASTSSAAATQTATEQSSNRSRTNNNAAEELLPSIITIEVVGYGGGEG